MYQPLTRAPQVRDYFRNDTTRFNSINVDDTYSFEDKCKSVFTLNRLVLQVAIHIHIDASSDSIGRA